jgi:ubiquinone/menaquinone biosynthesis C-methylase UbiE
MRLLKGGTDIMLNKKLFLAAGLSVFLIIAMHGLKAQEKETILSPENSNEELLNRLQPPDQVMDAIGVKSGMVVAEIGAGRGRYVVQLAVRVGEAGKVYAEDIDRASLEHLKERCARWNLQNVETILGESIDPKLPEGGLDLIFIISSYHEFRDPVALLRNARPALKTGGTLAIGEFLLPEGNHRIEPETIKAQMKEAGYTFVRVETFLKENDMYIYVFRKG